MLTVDAAATDYIASLQARHAPVATVKASADLNPLPTVQLDYRHGNR
jgi:hypothetical protein